MEKGKKESWRSRLHGIIYESNTIAGKAFDVSLLILIVASIITVMLDSVDKMARAVRQCIFYFGMDIHLPFYY